MTNPGSPSTESRRQRQRRELTEEIKAIARRQLEEGGRAGVSWRAIAREVGMNPASLYTYFASLDELFTELLIDSYRALADATHGAAAAAARRAPTNRLVDIALAYRRWALDHPAQYNLLFVDLIPGYEAPPDGPTVSSQVEVFRPFVETMNEVVDRPYPLDGPLDRAAERDLVGLFALLHGLVSLEVNHHLVWVSTGNEAIFRDRIQAAFAAIDR